MRISAVCAGRNFIVKSVQRLGQCSANAVFEHDGVVIQIARIRVPEPVAEYLQSEEIELLLTYRALQMAKDFARVEGLGSN